MKKSKLVFMMAILLMPGIQTVFPAAKYSVAVLPFANTNGDKNLDWLTQGIPETITNDLLSLEGIVIIERLQIRKIMDEQKLQHTGAIDETTAVSLGKLLGADILVVGAFQKQGDTIRLTARFVDVKTGGVIQTAKCTGKMDQIFDLQDQIVKDLMKNLNIELKQAEIAVLTEKPNPSLQAYQHYGQGALLQANKDYKGAVNEFEKAVQIDPAYSAAQEKFKESFWSLNKNNYWAYTIEFSTENATAMAAINSMGSIRRAGGTEIYDGKTAFTYIDEMTVDVSGNRGISLNTSYYIKGDDGIYLAGCKNEYSDKYSQSKSTTKYNPQIFSFPYKMEIGREWHTDSVNNIDAGNMQMAYSLKDNYKILDREKISVPAGIFDCYILEEEIISTMISSSLEYNKDQIGKPVISVGKYWFSPGIGIVKYVTIVDSKGAKQSVVMLLKEYHIEE